MVDKEAVEVVDNILLLVVAHHQDFVDDELLHQTMTYRTSNTAQSYLLGLLLQVHLLDGHRISPLCNGGKHHS